MLDSKNIASIFIFLWGGSTTESVKDDNEWMTLFGFVTSSTLNLPFSTTFQGKNIQARDALQVQTAVGSPYRGTPFCRGSYALFIEVISKYNCFSFLTFFILNWWSIHALIRVQVMGAAAKAERCRLPSLHLIGTAPQGGIPWCSQARWET